MTLNEGAIFVNCDLILIPQITSAMTLLPNTITLWGSGGSDLDISFWEDAIKPVTDT